MLNLPIYLSDEKWFHSTSRYKRENLPLDNYKKDDDCYIPDLAIHKRRYAT